MIWKFLCDSFCDTQDTFLTDNVCHYHQSVTTRSVSRRREMWFTVSWQVLREGVDNCVPHSAREVPQCDPRWEWTWFVLPANNIIKKILYYIYIYNKHNIIQINIYIYIIKYQRNYVFRELAYLNFVTTLIFILSKIVWLKV